MKTNRYERQSFLGVRSEDVFKTATVGVVGLGGGGSHIVQQLSHIGFQNFALFDADIVEDTNLNRLIGARTNDAKKGRRKTLVATRMIRGLQREANIQANSSRWEESSPALSECDVILSCLDSFAARRDLEAFARRNLVPLIDIGIDVHGNGISQPPNLTGQVILSMPGFPCMQCLGFLSETNLAREAQNYGAAGGRPQVVWPNGIVASTAVGLIVDLLTDWTKSLRGPVYLSYDGNRGTIVEHSRLGYAPTKCEHYPLFSAGAPIFRNL